MVLKYICNLENKAKTVLKDLFEQKRVFKLVCGAGNEDALEVERLVTIYSKAGCNFFDVCAKAEIIDAAKKGLERAGIKEDRYLCVSVGIDGDPHINKAFVQQEKCTKCGQCAKVCPHDAIEVFDVVKIKKERCLGCGQCENTCFQKAIEMKPQLLDYDVVLPKLVAKGIDCVEFHAISDNVEEVFDKWQKINDTFDGMLCISVDRSGMGDKQLVEMVGKMVTQRKPFTTIIQADGVAMSGNDDEYGTTLQAVATAQLFQNAKLPAYVMMSGGTNTKSTELAKKCGVFPHCVAVGSFARKIVKEYLVQDDILQNQTKLQEAVKIAKSLIDITLENMTSD